MDVERILVSKILATGDLSEVSDAGIRPAFFLDKQTRNVFETITEHKAEYGSVPTVRSMRRDFPNYEFLDAPEALDYLIKEIRRNHRLSLLEPALTAAVEAYDDDNDVDAEFILREALNQINVELPTTKDTDITKTGAQRLERYKKLAENQGKLLGIPSGFGIIDRATQGFQAKQLVTMVGPPKAGKSTTLLLAALAAHKTANNPLFIGFEMSNDEQEQRLDCMAAGISHHRLRDGSLKEKEWQLLQRSIHGMENMREFIFSNDTMSATTVSGIAAKIERYTPAVVYIDGVYMMQDEFGEKPGSPQALTNITRALKRMTQNFDVPIVITTQVLEWKMSAKAGISTNSIGYSSSFAQDSDVIIGVENTDDDTIKKVKIVAARNCGPVGTRVQWDWETGTFTELGEEFDEEGDDDPASY